jgi:hypothetical protein
MSQTINDDQLRTANDNSAPTARRAPLDNIKWKVLLNAIEHQRCTPFLGPEMAFGEQFFRSKIARRWARAHDYPLDDDDDLARVTQFIATNIDRTLPMDLFIRELKNIPAPDLNDANEPHRILAGLQLPIYVKTTFDDFMFRALELRKRDPRRELCHWNRHIDEPSVFNSDYEPTAANPLVFHLYGHMKNINSLVLTEDDHLDFLFNVARDHKRVLGCIDKALSTTVVLFLGYRLSDLDFRVLLRCLNRQLRDGRYGRNNSNLSVQLLTVGEGVSAERQASIEQYLSNYCSQLTLTTCLMTCREFLSELQERWTQFINAGGGNGLS